MKVPTCSRCHTQHYNVKPCPPSRPVETVLRPREEQREGRTHLDTLVAVGGNTFGQIRRPIHEETR